MSERLLYIRKLNELGSLVCRNEVLDVDCERATAEDVDFVRLVRTS